MTLADTGIRSIRVRDASNGAVVFDTGAPIDALIQALLATLTDAQKATACGITEPTTNRYWCYIPNADGSAGKIYVFSSFPSKGVAAFSAYKPTYQVAIGAPAANYSASTVTYTGLTIGTRYAWLPGANEVSITDGTTTLTAEGDFVAASTTVTVTGNAPTATYTGALSATTSFVPLKFVIYAGQVWARAAEGFYQFGGPGGMVYDNCGVDAKMPYLTADQAMTKKQFNGLDAALIGRWQIGLSTDFNTDKFTNVGNVKGSTFMGQRIGFSRVSTHYAFSMHEQSSGYARFAAIGIDFDVLGQ